MAPKMMRAARGGFQRRPEDMPHDGAFHEDAIPDEAPDGTV
jgi:hypothetical protein